MNAVLYLFLPLNWHSLFTIFLGFTVGSFGRFKVVFFLEAAFFCRLLSKGEATLLFLADVDSMEISFLQQRKAVLFQQNTLRHMTRQF